jgi:hypothetical protein
MRKVMSGRMIALMIALTSLLLKTWKGDAELLAFYLPRRELILTDARRPCHLATLRDLDVSIIGS